MGLTVAMLATLALAASADSPQDAGGWRSRFESLYAQGDYRAALEVADEGRRLAPGDPWAILAKMRALAVIDPDAARRDVAGLPNLAALDALAPEDRAGLETALGYLCLDLGLEPMAAMYFAEVPEPATAHARAQAGLAILAVRRGNRRLALLHFEAARAAVRKDPSLAELERDTRYEVLLQEFTTARDLRDANAAGRVLAGLDELRPSHPATLQARADLAQLRGDLAARERALRDLLAVDPRAPGAADQLVDTLLALNQPYGAYKVAREMAPERLAADAGLQAIEREYVPHFEVALDGRYRDGRADHDHFDLPRARIAWDGSDPRWRRLRILASAEYPESDRVPAGQPFGSLAALSAFSESQSAKGIGALAQWTPLNGLVLELGTTPTSFEVDHVVGALRFRATSAAGDFFAGADRSAVEDSFLSYAGALDPLDGRAFGGVVRNRAYVGARIVNGGLSVYGRLAGAVLDGERVDSNTEWRADAGFMRNAATGATWTARVGGAAEITGFEANRSHFTLGHGGYFSPERMLSVGPTFDLQGRRADRSFRLEGGVHWQDVRESSSPYFPTDAGLQAASGNLRYSGDSRDGIGMRIAASLEWRVTERTVAGIRLEGVRGEDADQVRLQVYARRWDHRVTDPVQRPPVALRGGELHVLN